MTKEEIKIGDTLVNSRYGKITFAKVIGIGTDSIGVIIDGEKDSIIFNQLKHWRIFENPIKDNRLVSGYTFAVRFKQFLKWIPKDWWMSQPHYFEEFEYMMHVANALLKYQIQTATDKNEIAYLKRLKLLK